MMLEWAAEEMVTCVEAKLGLRIRDVKPSDMGLREHSDPMDVGAVNSLSLSSAKGNGSSSPPHGCLKCGCTFSTILQCTQEQRQAIVWQRHHSQAKARVKKIKENPKEPQVRTKVPKACTRAEHRKLVFKLEIRGNLRNSGIGTGQYH